MNTVRKGDKFEKLCFNVISTSLAKEEFGIIPNHCKVFTKKGYYSFDRKSDIIFDLSIEVWPPEADRFSLLYIIECKDYSTKPVPVDDVEEFYAKVIQVSGLNVKGVFITSNTFQKGAYTFAKSKRIMLIEVNENITYNIILYKSNGYSQYQSELRLNNDKNARDRRIEVESQKIRRQLDKVIISAFVRHVKNELPQIQRRNPPVLSSEYIEEITIQLIEFIDSNIIRCHRYFPMNEYARILKKSFDLNIIDYDFSETDTNGNQIISSCSFIDKCIRIDRSLRNTARYNFMLAHEIGHYFLHNKLQIDQHSYDQFNDSVYNFKLGRFLLLNDKNWIEWQANQFAASLLMPTDSILFRFNKAQEKFGLKPGPPLYIDDQSCNQETLHKISGELAQFYQTTKTSVIYRLNSLGLINEKYSLRSLAQILDEILNGRVA